MARLKIKALQEIISLAIPISAFNLTTIFSAIAVGLMLGKLGNTALAAGALIGITQIFLMMVFSSPLFAISSIVSRLNVQESYLQIGGIVQQGSLFAAMLSIPPIIIMFFIKPILDKFGQPDNIIALVDVYCRSYVWGIPAAMLLTCSQQFMLGLKKTHVVTILGVISLVVTVLLGYIMAFGKLGFTPLGVGGLGYAQAARSWVTLLMILIFLKVKDDFIKYNLFKVRVMNHFSDLKKIIKLGWPISLHAASEYLAIFSLTLIAGSLGKNGLIAQQIASQYNQLLLIPLLGLSQASNLLVGTSVGKQNWEDMRLYGWISMVIGNCIGLVAVISFFLFTPLLVSPYLDTRENVDLIILLKPFLVISMVGQLLGSSKAICINILRALYDTKSPMIISIFASWGVVVPIAYIAVCLLGLGINSIAMSQALGMGLCAFLLIDKWIVLSAATADPTIKTSGICLQLRSILIARFKLVMLKAKSS